MRFFEGFAQMAGFVFGPDPASIQPAGGLSDRDLNRLATASGLPKRLVIAWSKGLTLAPQVEFVIEENAIDLGLRAAPATAPQSTADTPKKGDDLHNPRSTPAPSVPAALPGARVISVEAWLDRCTTAAEFREGATPKAAFEHYTTRAVVPESEEKFRRLLAALGVHSKVVRSGLGVSRRYPLTLVR